jgi:hypothetical protein
MSLKEILEIFLFLPPIILFTGLLVGTIVYKRINTHYKLILLYLVLCFVTDILNRYFGNIFKSNLILFPIFSFIELSIFSVLYYLFIIKSSSKLLKFFIAIVLLFIIVDIANVDMYNTKSFQSYGKVFDNLTVILLSLLYIWKLLKNTDNTFDKHLPVFNFGVLMYFSVNLLIFIPLNFLVNSQSHVIYYFWMINLVVTILFYLFLIYMIWLNGKILKL